MLLSFWNNFFGFIFFFTFVNIAFGISLYFVFNFVLLMILERRKAIKTLIWGVLVPIAIYVALYGYMLSGGEELFKKYNMNMVALSFFVYIVPAIQLVIYLLFLIYSKTSSFLMAIYLIIVQGIAAIIVFLIAESNALWPMLILDAFYIVFMLIKGVIRGK